MHLDMFEVVIINRSPNRWEWLVYNRDRIPIMQGWARTARQPNIKASAHCSPFWRPAGDRMTRPKRPRDGLNARPGRMVRRTGGAGSRAN
jgi:hypothetical protein